MSLVMRTVKFANDNQHLSNGFLLRFWEQWSSFGISSSNPNSAPPALVDLTEVRSRIIPNSYVLGAGLGKFIWISEGVLASWENAAPPNLSPIRVRG